MIDRERLLKNFIEQKDYMEDKIHHGIETNRKGYCRIDLTDQEGKPVQGAKIHVKQLSHDFLFGCNIFKLGCFPTAEENARYEENFLNLFNYAIVPFYWDSFEPENGKPRFEKDSPFIDRRPPAEAVVEFCKEHDLTMKGHCLYWALMAPQWLPENFEETKKYIMRRMKQIAQRYDGVMESFDVVNESAYKLLPINEYSKAVRVQNHAPAMNGDYTEWCFKQADRMFWESKLNINEVTDVWRVPVKENSLYWLQIDSLLRRGCRIDQIGLQYHLMYADPDTVYDRSTDFFDPQKLYRAMDCYGKFGLPHSISEISMFGHDEDIQAEVLRNLYSIWFSHPNSRSIVYWNLGDNCFIKEPGWDETRFKGGLCGADGRRKPAYEMLDQLINKEWHTELDIDTSDTYAWFKGFYGKYEITAVHEGKEVKRIVNFTKDGFEGSTLAF